MNRKFLNIVNLDGEVIIKKGSGGGGVTINNQEKSVDITENGTTEVVADAGFTGLSKVVVNTNVASSGGGSGWTGHADAEGLRAIGWTDEDIADFQQYGVYWDAEDDEYHKVTDDNKALYGVLTADNIQTYKNRIVYLPKIDTSKKRTMNNLFEGCKNMVAMPKIAMNDVTKVNGMFSSCHCLTYVPYLDLSSLQGEQNLFFHCYSLRVISILDVANITSFYQTFEECFSLKYVKIKNLSTSINIRDAAAFSKASLLYMINNEANTETKSIGLMYRAYDYLSADVDVKSALTAHPNITLTRLV